MQQSGNDNNQVNGDDNIIINQYNVFEISHKKEIKNYEDSPMDTKVFKYMSGKTAITMIGVMMLAPMYMLYILLTHQGFVTFYSWWGIIGYLSLVFASFTFIPYFRSVTWINPKLGTLNIEDTYIYFDEIRRIELGVVENRERIFRVYKWGDVSPSSVSLTTEHAAKYMFDAVKYGIGIRE